MGQTGRYREKVTERDRQTNRQIVRGEERKINFFRIKIFCNEIKIKSSYLDGGT